MRNIVPFVLIMGFASNLTIRAQAQPDIENPARDPHVSPDVPSNPPMGVPEVDIKKEVNGTVQGIGISSENLQIRENSGSVSILRINPDDKIQRDGKTVQLSDLKVGDQVTLTLQ